jgi:glycosyltransferase involved in cell wall biosynthesis
MPAKTTAATRENTVLHYVGADDDRGGIVSVVRALAGAGGFACVLGVNPGFQQHRAPPVMATLELPWIAGEELGIRTFWRARVVARAVQAWLDGDASRIFHGHSRAGLAVALSLARAGERRVVASVHCYGRQRWFYRWAARRLGSRLFWLTPAMKRYYGIGADETWAQCIPGCVPEPAVTGREVPRDRTRRPVRIGGIGALVAWKRWDLVVAALAALPPAARGQLRFIHIGGPDDSAESRKFAAALRTQTVAQGLGEIVEWRGAQPSARPLLEEIDCLVVTSHHEPFSVAMLEALAAGVPVVAANSGGARDVLVPPLNGWLFRSGEAGDLARVFELLAAGDALGRVQIAPKQLRSFTAPVVAAQWAGVYARLSAGE